MPKSLLTLTQEYADKCLTTWSSEKKWPPKILFLAFSDFPIVNNGKFKLPIVNKLTKI